MHWKSRLLSRLFSRETGATATEHSTWILLPFSAHDFARDFRGTKLVARVGIRVQKHDADDLDAGVDQLVRAASATSRSSSGIRISPDFRWLSPWMLPPHMRSLIPITSEGGISGADGDATC